MVQAAYVLCRCTLLTDIQGMSLELIMVRCVVEGDAVHSLLAQWNCCSAASSFAHLLLPVNVQRGNDLHSQECNLTPQTAMCIGNHQGCTKHTEIVTSNFESKAAQNKTT